MQPRHVSSNKWTHFPTEFSNQIQEVFLEHFRDELKAANLVIEGRIYTEEILLRVGFLEKGRLVQNNFEASLDFAFDKQNAIEAVHSMVDSVATIMGDFFEANGEKELPREWTEYQFNKLKIFIQYSTVNSNLEAQADQLLGTHLDDLIKAEVESEDAFNFISEKIKTEEEPEDNEIDDIEDTLVIGPDNQGSSSKSKLH